MRRSNDSLVLPGWPRVLDVHLAASYLSVGEQTIRDYVTAGLLQVLELPGSSLRLKGHAAGKTRERIHKLLFAIEDLDKFVDERKGAA